MEGKQNRRAQFRTVIAFVKDSKHFCFEGICRGQIAFEPLGQSGFGYDPIFIPDGYNQTFAQMPLAKKNLVRFFRTIS